MLDHFNDRYKKYITDDDSILQPKVHALAAPHRMTINSTNNEVQMQSSTVYRVEVCAYPSGIIKIKVHP